eukprot:jgi/Psemu1/290106/fgenesh1_pg.448_\
MVTVAILDGSTELADGSNNNTSNSDASKKIVKVLNGRKCSDALFDQKQYEKRLLTFQASTYYAKPPCLSPLFCARFGWENADKDMLVCSSCSSALAVTLNSKLSANTFDKLCHAYRNKIVCNHETNCPFRLSSVDELRSLEAAEDQPDEEASEENSKIDTVHVHLTVPVYMGQVLQDDAIRLMEHPKPSTLLKQRAKKIFKALRSVSCAMSSNGSTDQNEEGAENDASPCRYPRLQIPSKIRQMDTKSVLTKLLDCDDISILALSLLGWDPIPNKRGDDSDGTVSVGCPMCLSIMKLVPEQNKEEKGDDDSSDVSGSDRSTKRQRMSCRNTDPLEAHRHYCPYKVGFPKKSTDTNPVWKIILERLSKEQQSYEAQKSIEVRDEGAGVPVGVFDKSIERVRRILRSGIAPKEIDLNA